MAAWALRDFSNEKTKLTWIRGGSRRGYRSEACRKPMLNMCTVGQQVVSEQWEGCAVCWTLCAFSSMVFLFLCVSVWLLHTYSTLEEPLQDPSSKSDGRVIAALVAAMSWFAGTLEISATVSSVSRDLPCKALDVVICGIYWERLTSYTKPATKCNAMRPT